VKVLIADDHGLFRQLLRTVLGSADREYAECDDGREALARCFEFRPDLVLLDIAMGGLDGLSVTSRIKTGLPGVRVFVLSQYDEPGFEEAALGAGADAYLLKEDLPALKAKVANLARPGPGTRTVLPNPPPEWVNPARSGRTEAGAGE
jgi:CheY-like chemotaxis protein